MLRRMMAAIEKATKELRLDGPHDYDILPNDRWETYQQPYLAKKPVRTVVQFAQSGCPKPEMEACYELESFLRFLIFDCKRWRPATNTSTIITLVPKDGFRRRFWVNGTLLGMRDTSGKVREMNLMVERYPRFPTQRSLEEYCWSRLPFDYASEEEIRVLAKNIDKRFGVIGRTDVREFTLRRKVKVNKRTGNKLMVIFLRWDMEGEQNWGCTFWKAYLEEDSSRRVSFIFSRVTCHISLRNWIANRLPMPWKYDILLKPRAPPLYHLDRTRQALTWLQILDCVVLKKPAVVVSFEDDPITGLPEDISDGLSFEDIKNTFEFGPPEVRICKFSLSGPNKLGGVPQEPLKPNWRLIDPADSIRMLWQISRFTNDPNILPPHNTSITFSPDGQLFVPRYRPRIPLRQSYPTPSMMMITLQPEGVEFLSGFIEDSTQPTTRMFSCGPPISRASVAFKSSPAVIDPRDIQRAVVIAFNTL